MARSVRAGRLERVVAMLEEPTDSPAFEQAFEAASLEEFADVCVLFELGLALKGDECELLRLRLAFARSGRES